MAHTKDGKRKRKEERDQKVRGRKWHRKNGEKAGNEQGAGKNGWEGEK